MARPVEGQALREDIGWAQGRGAFQKGIVLLLRGAYQKWLRFLI